MQVWHWRIHDNIVTHNGADGIQVGCSRKDTYIYNNYIYDAGRLPFNGRGHTKGFQLGEGTTGHLYNNYVEFVASDCLWAVGGPSDDGSDVSLWVYNNVFKNCDQAVGVARDSAGLVDTGQSMEFYNNTIINMRRAHYFVSGQIYNDIILNSINNLYVNNGTDDNGDNLPRFAQGATPDNFTETYAFITADSSELAFADDTTGDYRLTLASPVIDMGSSPLLITDLDLTGQVRDTAYDIGAFEYISDGGYAQIEGNSQGKLYFRYFPGAPNIPDNRIDVVTLGHSALKFSIKLDAGSPVLSSILVSLRAGSQIKEVALSNYIDSLNSDWTTRTIPVSDFPFSAGKLEKGIYEFGFRATDSAGTFSIGFDEVQFTGGAEDFIWYGDNYADSVDPTSIYTSKPDQFYFVTEQPSGGL